MSKEPSDKGRRRHLSPDDTALWEHTAASLKPLKRQRHRVHPAAPDEPAAAKAPRAAGKSAAHHAPAPLDQRIARLEIGAIPPAPVVPAAKVPDFNTFDRKAARKLRQGQFEIEARIDLHGMRQVEAHGALRRFIFSCHSRGLRWVLVITGKGTSQRQRDEDEGFGFMAERGVGVLRRNVPMWLAEPELRAIIVSFTTAAAQHGGEGALYIQLRNPERVRR